MSIRHGHTWRDSATGKPRMSPTYKSWDAMRQRVGNPRSPRYDRYGGRGIAICERWADFVNFLADMGNRPAGTTLDRIDNDRGYEPGNCRWATRSQQNRNRTPSAASLANLVPGAGLVCDRDGGGRLVRLVRNA